LYVSYYTKFIAIEVQDILAPKNLNWIAVTVTGIYYRLSPNSGSLSILPQKTADWKSRTGVANTAPEIPIDL